ncbi:MAG: hypothetical protein SF052_21615 [Bacteroidia bacterium]|nr:hypothetical protein [Bacteroidia bacterium]
MKRLLSLIYLIIGLSFTLFAQKNHAINYRVTAADDSKVQITYDLPPNGSHRAFDVTLQTKNPSVRPRTVQGTGKGIFSGTNLVIDWYYTADGYSKADLTGLEIVVMAIDPLEEPSMETPEKREVRTISPWAGLGAVAASGVGLLTTGVVSETNAQSDYEIYTTNLNPSAPIYTELGLTRDDLYNEANSKHKRATALMIGGGVVIAAAGVILINRLKVQKKIKNMQSSRLELSPVYQSVSTPNNASGHNIGLNIGWKF